MRTKLIGAALWAMSALSAFAHPHGDGTPDEGSPLGRFISAVLPFVMIGLLLYWYLRKAQNSPRAKQTEDYMARHQAHLDKAERHQENVERSLERIASALEKRNSDGASKN